MGNMKQFDVEGASYAPVPPSEDKETVQALDLDYPIKPRNNNSNKKVKPGKKWCKILCLVVVSLILLCVATVLCLSIGAYMWTRHQVHRFTVTEPVELPVHQVSVEELEILKDRTKLFFDMLQADNVVPREDLTITMDEINGLIAQSDYLRGHAWVSLQEANKISADVSLPAKFLPGGRDRYFVASGSVQVESAPAVDAAMDPNHVALVKLVLDTLQPIEQVQGPLFAGEFLVYPSNQELVVNVLSGKFMNWIVPQDYIDEKENLLHDMYEDHHPHHHGHHHHGHHHGDEDHHDHHGHDHHGHHGHGHDGCHMKKILPKIDSVSIQEGSITVHVRRTPNDEVTNESITGVPEDSVTVRTASWHGGARKLLTKIFM